MKEIKKIVELQELEIGFSRDRKMPLSLMSDISLSANEGEFIALIGQNGIGKSTLLKTLVKLHPCLSGEIFMQGKRIQDFSMHDFSKFVGYVSTEVIRTGNLKVQDLVSLGRYPYTNWIGKLTNHDQEMVDSALEMVGLNGLKHKNITEVSDGERQRAMIARTIAQDTKILILDEPTAFLDLPNRYDVLHLLKSLSHNQGKTIIFSTHDLGLVLHEVDKIWVMTESGVLEGCPEDLALSQAFDQLFPDSPISLDAKSGNFVYPFVPYKKIRVKGKGDRFNWTKKALERNSYELVEETNVPAVEIKENTWVLFQNNKSHTCYSIQELLGKIKI